VFSGVRSKPHTEILFRHIVSFSNRRCQVTAIARYFPAQKWILQRTSFPASDSQERRKARRMTAEQRKHLIAGDFANSVLPFCENSAYMGKVIGDHAQADPPFHPGVAPVEAAPKTVPSLEDADATLTSGPPLLSLFEPALLLFAFAVGAFRGATWNAHPLDSPVMRRSFVLGRVERGIAGHQARNATELFLMRVQGGQSPALSHWALLVYGIVGDNLILAFLDLDHLAKLRRLAGLALANNSVVGSKILDQFPRRRGYRRRRSAVWPAGSLAALAGRWCPVSCRSPLRAACSITSAERFTLGNLVGKSLGLSTTRPTVDKSFRIPAASALDSVRPWSALCGRFPKCGTSRSTAIPKLAPCLPAISPIRFIARISTRTPVAQQIAVGRIVDIRLPHRCVQTHLAALYDVVLLASSTTRQWIFSTSSGLMPIPNVP